MSLFRTPRRTVDSAMRGRLKALVGAAVTDEMTESDIADCLKRGPQIRQQVQEILKPRNDAFERWYDPYVEREGRILRGFFGNSYQPSDLEIFAATLRSVGEKRVQGWATLGLEPHWLPKVMYSANFPGQRVSFASNYLEAVSKGQIFRMINGAKTAVERAGLDGMVALVDLCPLPKDSYTPFENGGKYLGQILKALREAKLIPKQRRGSLTSRFGVLPEDWQYIKPALERSVGDVSWYFGETYFTFWYLGHVLRNADAKSEAGVWLEEYWGDFKGWAGYFTEEVESGLSCFQEATRFYETAIQTDIALRPIGIIPFPR